MGGFFGFRPEDRARRHGVDAHFGRQLDRQRPRQAEQPGLGGAVQRVAGQRPFGMHVGHIDDGAARRAQIGSGRLRQKKRRLQVAADQVIPGGGVDAAQRRCKEGRCVVDQRIEPAKAGDDSLDEPLRGFCRA